MHDQYRSIRIGLILPATLLALCTDSNAGAGVPHARRPPADEAAWAREVLDASRGATRILCGLAARAVEATYGFGPWTPPAAVADSSAALHWALTWARSDDAIPVLLNGLNESDPCVRAVAARLIARARSATAAAGLVRALTSQAAGTRAAAAVALGLGEVSSAANPLIDHLGDADAEVRAASAWALGLPT